MEEKKLTKEDIISRIQGVTYLKYFCKECGYEICEGGLCMFDCSKDAECFVDRPYLVAKFVFKEFKEGCGG